MKKVYGTSKGTKKKENYSVSTLSTFGVDSVRPCEPNVDGMDGKVEASSGYYLKFPGIYVWWWLGVFMGI